MRILSWLAVKTDDQDNKSSMEVDTKRIQDLRRKFDSSRQTVENNQILSKPTFRHAQCCCPNMMTYDFMNAIVVLQFNQSPEMRIKNDTIRNKSINDYQSSGQSRYGCT